MLIVVCVCSLQQSQSSQHQEAVVRIEETVQRTKRCVRGVWVMNRVVLSILK